MLLPCSTSMLYWGLMLARIIKGCSFMSRLIVRMRIMLAHLLSRRQIRLQFTLEWYIVGCHPFFISTNLDSLYYRMHWEKILIFALRHDFTFERSQIRWQFIGLSVLNIICHWAESWLIKWFLYVKFTYVMHVDLNVTSQKKGNPYIWYTLSVTRQIY